MPSWPFLNKTEKLDRLEPCCSEFNVLQVLQHVILGAAWLQTAAENGVSDSVLGPKQIRLVSKSDTKAKGLGVKNIGQDPQLL